MYADLVLFSLSVERFSTSTYMTIFNYSLRISWTVKWVGAFYNHNKNRSKLKRFCYRLVTYD